ncbi:unnamed protein product [Allacma fusca]|uniref:Uncharacterized protein n=1 Tax=Allacma fusca TaxID=39272 RepID=A0A8J2K6P2_9HEXA|nr:unnamed protein product [Allacma fusca]
MPECKTRYCLLRNRARIPSGPIVTFVYILTFRVLRTLSTLYPLTRQSEGDFPFDKKYILPGSSTSIRFSTL